MPSELDSTGRDGQNLKGKVVVSKKVFALGVIFIIFIIVAVGLIAGFVGKSMGRRRTSSADVPTSTSSNIDQTTITISTLPPGPWTSIRLPKSITPINYVVDLQPNLTPISGDISDGYFVFNGTSSVEFVVNETTPYIILHSDKLNYSKVEVTDVKETILSSRHALYKENEYLVVTMDYNLTEGSRYFLQTEFAGELLDSLGGLYRTTYTTKDGQSKVIAVTQMQATHARKAFPCFDEPALKATFDVYLWHEPPNFALSNMPNVSTEAMYGNWMRTKFKTTVKMSTYLLAFVVCDFDYVESFTSTGVQTRIYAQHHQIADGHGGYAKEITPKLLDHFTDLFNVSYPLSKSDQIAVLNFGAGAMENWGLVIYQERALLYDPLTDTAKHKKFVADVVSHELTHQWFGNLVTPLWWDELWLSEGFARYGEYIGVDAIEPTWHVKDHFIVSTFQSVMRADSRALSRPIVAQNINTPFDIKALFDTISYSKGACILRMINEVTGDEAFKLGLKNYLDKHSYGPVQHTQLFGFWEQAIQLTQGDNPPDGFIESMDTWILQMGYPTVSMMRSNKDPTTVDITQERFLLDPKANASEPPSPYNYQWVVPLWYTKENDNGVKTLIWMERNATDPISVDVPSDEYFIGNYEAFGFYRVNYDQENWLRIARQLNIDFSAIDVRSRGQLISDAFNLARSGKLTYDVALNLTTFLKQDFNFVPWESVLDEMWYLSVLLARSHVYGVYSEYMRNLIHPLYNYVTWNDTGEQLVQYQRINAIAIACLHNHPDCVATAQAHFAEWMNSSGNNISPNLRTNVYCNGIRYGGIKQWEFVWRRYKTESNFRERARLKFALTCVREPWITQRFLDLVLDNTLLQRQDKNYFIQFLCYNDYTRDITWDFVRSQWNHLFNANGSSSLSMSGIIRSCSYLFSTEFELQELEKLKQTYDDKEESTLRAIKQGIEKTKSNIEWRKDYEGVFFNWLTKAVAAMNKL